VGFFSGESALMVESDGSPEVTLSDMYYIIMMLTLRCLIKRTRSHPPARAAKLTRQYFNETMIIITSTVGELLVLIPHPMS
jgi:hypothetical protein